MANENVNPVFKPILDAIYQPGDNQVYKIKIGDFASSRHGRCRITGIEMVSPETAFPDDEDNIAMKEIWSCDKDRCVFVFDNNHWAWGMNVTLEK